MFLFSIWFWELLQCLHTQIVIWCILALVLDILRRYGVTNSVSWFGSVGSYACEEVELRWTSRFYANITQLEWRFVIAACQCVLTLSSFLCICLSNTCLIWWLPEELDGFDEAWNGKARQHLPGWNQGYGMLENRNSGKYLLK